MKCLILLTILITAFCAELDSRCYRGKELNSLPTPPCDSLKDIDKVLCESKPCKDLGRDLPPDALFCCCSEKYPCH